MLIHLIAVGNRMPEWVEHGFDDYAKRMPRECRMVLKEIAPARGTKRSDKSRQVDDEGQRILKAIPNQAYVIALDLRGEEWSSGELSLALVEWLTLGRDVALLVGGPEGLSAECLRRAEKRWRLSRLTFPHTFVRIMVAEQLYRAWGISRNHPYHR